MSSNKSPMEKLTSILGNLLESKLKDVKYDVMTENQTVVVAIDSLNRRLDSIEKIIDGNNRNNNMNKNVKSLQMAVDLLLLRIDELETKINTAPIQIPNVRINEAGPSDNMFKQDNDLGLDFD